MDKKKEQVILKLNKIKGWANDIIMRSKKMEQLLESINKANPDIQDLTILTICPNAHLHFQLRTLQRSAFTCFVREGGFVDWDGRYQVPFKK